MGARHYGGERVAFLTQHGKERLVRPLVEARLHCTLVHTDAWDTDTLGTFTREIVRPGLQIEAARLKAKKGMDLTGLSVGMSSEGAFGTDPLSGLLSWDLEIVLWQDRRRGLEVIGFADGPAKNLQRPIESWGALLHFAEEAGFPSHHLVLRASEADDALIIKGLSDEVRLRDAYSQCREASTTGVLFAENDLRSFANPTRQAVIERATQDLISKLETPCPQCREPGYTVRERKRGRPCRQCGTATRLPALEVWACSLCQHEETRPLQPALAEPGFCDRCNP